MKCTLHSNYYVQDVWAWKWSSPGTKFLASNNIQYISDLLRSELLSRTCNSKKTSATTKLTQYGLNLRSQSYMKSRWAQVQLSSWHLAIPHGLHCVFGWQNLHKRSYCKHTNSWHTCFQITCQGFSCLVMILVFLNPQGLWTLCLFGDANTCLSAFTAINICEQGLLH